MRRVLLILGLVIRMAAYGAAALLANEVEYPYDLAVIVAVLSAIELTVLRLTDRATGLHAARERGFLRSLRA